MVLNTSKAFLGSIGIHLLLLSGFLLSFTFDSDETALPPAANKNVPEPVMAEMLDSAQVELEVARLQAFEDQKLKAEQDRQKKLDDDAAAARKKRQDEEKRLAELEAKRKTEAAKAEQQRKAEVQRLAQAEKARKTAEQQKQALEKQRIAEEQKLKELAVQKQKQAEEKARLEAENQRIAAEQKKAEAARQKAEADRKAKALAEERAKKAAAKKKAEADARQKAFDNELAAAIAAEENSGEKARDREIYRGLIAQAVQRQWVRPPSVNVAECVVRVSQIPGGEVTRVQPVSGRCGGDDFFQRSVIKAVEAASPLPSPPNPDVFEREIEFLFRPQ